MQLITKTTIWYLLISIFVFGLGGIVTYNLISEEIRKETDYYLHGILQRIDKRLEHYVENDLDVARMNGNRVQIREILGGHASGPSYTDTLAIHPHLNQMETMRKLTAVREVRGHAFKVEITDVIVEDSDIYESVIKIITRLFILLALALLLGGFVISKFLMRPFHASMDSIDAFRLQDSKPLQLSHSSTKEFKQLNAFISSMSQRARAEYQALKSFSENASHELQTPLAIAQGKLDLILQGEPLSEDQYKNIQSAQTSLSRLSKLSRSLAILTKLNNREFNADQTTDVSELITSSLDDFRELFSLKNLTLTSEIQDDVSLRLNSHLGVIMVNNLLHNSIKHNVEGGKVHVQLTGDAFTVSNSGAAPERPREDMFQRFAKDSGLKDSSGLGLAIVKEICDYHGFEVEYTYDDVHTITVSFS